MPQKSTKSKAQGFTHGMVSDADPRFQIKGSYSDGQNIRLTNSTGDTFTVENINGNSLFIDLFALNYQNKAEAWDNSVAGILGTRPDILLIAFPGPSSTDYFSEIYWDPNNTDANGNLVGPFYPSPQSIPPQTNADGVYTFFDSSANSQEHRSSIVGYTSFGNELILIIVKKDDYSPAKERTVFIRIVFDVNMNVIKVEDLAVCYSEQGDEYPDLGMKIDQPVRVESMVENECIARIYWTDNINPLRTLNLLQKGKNQLNPSSLDITPLMDTSQAILGYTIYGSLPVGVYQYVYKYISSNGGETTFSPLSNLYHVSDQSFTSSETYGGGPKGELGTQGFKINIRDIDQSFTYIELYALLYEDLNMPPRISLVDRKRLSGLTQASFSHVSWNNEIENGLEEILIESNTWDICKDIAIKDNILFAANLRQKKNWISETEWNVKVLRYSIEQSQPNGGLFKDGMLTTNDPEIKHYEGDGAGGFQIPEQPVGTQQPCTGWLDLGVEHRPSWATFIDKQRAGPSNALSGSVKVSEEYRFLRDGMTLGGESWDYEENELGGCRVTFGLQEKVADITTNDGNKPYISSVNNGLEDFQTDNIWGNDTTAGSFTNNTDTKFWTSMAIAGGMDPHNAGDKRGYQRGEIYRFGVQIYDNNGAPGNVLWIGDIQMPEMYDVLRQLDPDKPGYNPLAATINGQSSAIFDLLTTTSIVSSDKIDDHRLSFVYGHTIPPVDVDWFTGRTASSIINANAYLSPNGTLKSAWGGLNPVSLESALAGTRAKSFPWWSTIPNLTSHDDKHYLFDLYVNFEFAIPENIMKKISGFRVVRAERTESDRRIIQQGVLNQTIQYGTTTDLSIGYDHDFPWSRKDNENMDDEPVFTNDYNETSPSLPVQPEYDTYLNGYVGLAENNHLAWWDESITTGKIKAGLNAGKLYAFFENEDGRNRGAGSTTWPFRNLPSLNAPATNKFHGEHTGPGTEGEFHGHSAFFGSYEKCQGGYYTGTTTPRANQMAPLEEYIFTLDSPDSAFGTRPYLFKEGDMLRIDSVMKLTDEERYINDATPTYPGKHVHIGWSHTKFITGNSWLSEKPGLSGVGATEDQATRFSSKKVLDSDKDYGMLLGKYYIYDTYWGIGMETDGGATYAEGYNTNMTDTAEPTSDYRYFAEISIAKEIGAGEILPSGFFKNSWKMNNGDVHGFSNHTLGVVSDRSPFNAKWGGPRSVVGQPALVTRLNGSVGSSSTPNTTTQDDLNYNTMSTLQMGLRSIILEVGGVSEFCFHPRDLTSILCNQDWRPRNLSSGLPDPTLFDKNYLGHGQKISGPGGVAQLGWGSYIPFKYLCSIVRKTIPYDGYSKSAIESTRYVPAGNFHPIIIENYSGASKTGHLSKVFGGDTFVNLYAHQKTSCPYMRNSYARWQVFPVESFVNTDMRSGLNLGSGDTEVGESYTTPPFSNDWLYNEVYSQENNIKSSIMIDEQEACDALDLPYEIAYSNTKISGEPGDAFRVFPINQFHDMEGQYGEINRIINFKNDIYVLQDEAFAKLLVNPISMITDDTGVGIFTGTGDTVENHTYVTTKFGSRHLWSVIGSEEALYFVDSRFARLFKYDTEKLISLGDSLGLRSRLENLIKNSIGDLDSFKKGTGWNSRNYIADNHLKYLGIQLMFDHRNKELLMTAHNSKDITPPLFQAKLSETLVFNEGLNAFSSYYSFWPTLWMLADPSIISTGNEMSVSQSMYADSIGSTISADTREGSLKLWTWDSAPAKCFFFPDQYNINQQEQYPASITKVINDAAESAKVFDNGEIIMTGGAGIVSPGAPMGVDVALACQTENNSPQSSPAQLSRYRDGVLRFPTRGLTNTERLRGTWLKMNFQYNGPEKFNIFAMIAKYRKSYN